MDALRNLTDDYYFVWLGREPGGYLDVLGLPPTASEVEAKNRQREYLSELERDFKNKRKKLRERLEEEEITKEEFNAQVNEWKDEKRKKEVGIIKLKENFDLSLAEKRELESKGFVDDNVIWFDMYKTLSSSTDSEYLKELFFKKRPLPEIEQSLLESVRSPGNYSPNSFEKYRKIKLKKFQNFFNEMNLSFLLKADELWSKLKYTNLEYWLNELKEWRRELDLISPRLDSFRRVKVSNFADEPNFPTLCKPFTLAIERLESDDMEDLSRMPERRGDMKQTELAALLAEILARKSMADTNKSKDENIAVDNFRPTHPGDMFMDLLGLLLDTEEVI